jgi:signal transduction histidine kinase
MIDIIQQDRNFYKALIIVVSCLLCMTAAFYSNLYLKADIVYTHYFYIPIILTGIWYGKETIYLALYLGVFHVFINYTAFGSITLSSLQRALIFIMIASIIYVLTGLMKNAYQMVYAIQQYGILNKKLIVFFACLLCMIGAVFVNLYLKEDVVYTHFFYIPIILTGIWYGINAVYLAIFLGIFHVALNYLAFGLISLSSIQRALVFVVIALIIYMLTNFRYGQLDHESILLNKEGPIDKNSVDPRLEKIDMVGQLGVAVGHEIRNPLTTVRGFLQMLGNEKNYEGAEEYFSLMIEEIDRADATIGHVINLAHNKTNHPERQNLNHIIEDYLSEGLFVPKPSNIKIKTRLSPISDLLLDKMEINELIENLLSNAIEAMPEGGVITVSTEKVNNEVLFTVQDQGSGISGVTARKIGIPFFTTKENSAGLGLAICYSIARRHSARIEFISTPRGTRFMVRFPALGSQQDTVHEVLG